MAGIIPKGYEKARYQGFKVFDEIGDFLQYSCNNCTKKPVCGHYKALSSAPEQDSSEEESSPSYWVRSFARLNPKKPSKTLKEKVMCIEFKEA